MNEKVYKEAEGMNDMTENEMEFRIEEIQSELRMCLKTFIMVCLAVTVHEEFPYYRVKYAAEIIRSLNTHQEGSGYSQTVSSLLDKRGAR